MAKVKSNKAAIEALVVESQDEPKGPKLNNYQRRKLAESKESWPKFGFPKVFDPSSPYTFPVFSGESKKDWHVYDTPTEAAQAFRKKFAKELAELQTQRGYR